MYSDYIISLLYYIGHLAPGITNEGPGYCNIVLSPIYKMADTIATVNLSSFTSFVRKRYRNIDLFNGHVTTPMATEFLFSSPRLQLNTRDRFRFN